MIYVNLTTTNNRLDLCMATLWSLIHQNMNGYKINLWISDHPYMSDEGINFDIPQIKELNSINNIISVKYTNNIGPYRKFIPALREFNDDDVIVYADDDVVYGSKWLVSLVSDLEKYQFKTVVASRVRKYKKNIFGMYKGYKHSFIVKENVTLSDDYILTGVGGVAFLKKVISEKYINNDDFINVCPKTDDVWISFLIKLSNVDVKVCINALKECYEISHSNNSLSEINVYARKVDKFKTFYKVINNLKSYFGVPVSNNDISMRNAASYFLKNNGGKND